MISFLTESWFPAKRNGDFQAPDRWWILPRIIHFEEILRYIQGNVDLEEE